MITKWTNLPELPNFYDKYIMKVDNIPLLEALSVHSPSAILSDFHKLEALKSKVYAPEKWTIKTIVQHLIDTERIMAYRALCFARSDKTELPGFDENKYAKYAPAEKRFLKEMLKEWETVRQASIQLFESFDEKTLYNEGIASGRNLSVAAIGYIICGHPIHHKQIIEERYFPLLEDQPL
ncbi:DinB family protein [Marinilongibacter aquaticus]|uniref:DinB family protein n=1 Tax=Marinilongibacter aquaticus TaxID=2975157 RepID=UPI0021BD9790|nr:DinB family protein [Marinilongibacter aquaticus]UBM58507.1 DinB family protein [Marinilongibacter aquaticus]